MNISEQPLDPNFLRIHPRGYTEEPIAEDKMGGRNQMREKIAELIRELEKERKRSARWKRIAKAYYKREGVLFKTVMRYWYERAVVRSKYGNSAWEISSDRQTD